MSFVLMTNAYDEPDLQRRLEYAICLARNLPHPLIESVYLSLESCAEHPHWLPKHDKLNTSWRTRRMRFSEYLQTASDMFAPGTRVILANADVYFDDTLELLDRSLKGLCACLSRWDVRDSGAFMSELPSSQDAWVFETPIRLPDADFPLGLPGSDGRFARIARDAGYQLFNPAKSVHAFHLHQVPVRHYQEAERIAGPYQDVWATDEIPPP